MYVTFADVSRINSPARRVAPQNQAPAPYFGPFQGEIFVKQYILVSIVLVAVGLSACARNPAEEVSQAQVGEAVEPEATEPEATEPEATEPEATPAGPETLAVTAENSRVEFEGSKVTGSHTGNFPDFTGSVTFDPSDLTASSVSITIDTTTLVSDNERLTGHLRSDDFFDVAVHPTSTFESTSIAAGGADGATHTITGNLTLVGQTRSISFPATLAVTDAALTAQAEFFILRQDFGIEYPGRPDDLIRNEVVIRLNLNLPRG